MVKQIAHMALEISNLEKSVAFYCGALGLEYKFDGRDENGVIRMVYLQVCEGVFIEMFPSGIHKAERKDYLIGYHHLCFEVDDIQKSAEEIQAKGYTLSHPVQKGSDNSWQFWVNDPDGNPIEFMQYTKESKQLACN